MELTDRLILDQLGLGDGLEADMPPGRKINRSPRRALKRMLAGEQLREAMPSMPAAGESVHIISNGAYDFATWIPQIVDWVGKADELLCSTWTLSRPNALEVFAIHDAGQIVNGKLSFLTGLYFKRRETAVYSLFLDGLRERSGRYKCFENHAKVLLVASEAKGAWLTVEGSANLNSNPRYEQYVISNDRALYEFHRAWMDEVFAAPPKIGRPRKPKAGNPGAAAPHRGYSQRRAGLGVTTVTADAHARKAMIRWKLAPILDAAGTSRYAGEIADLIRQWIPVVPAGAIITCPPQGASWPARDHAAEAVARSVAEKLAAPFATLIHRTDAKARHHPSAAMQQSAFLFSQCDPPAKTIIIVDDMITSGTTMRRSMEAVAAAGLPVFGFAWNGA